SEPRLRLADEPAEPDEPHPAPEELGDPAAEGPPPAEPRLHVTEDELRERLPGAGAPSPPPPPPSVAPVDDVSAVHEEPVAPPPPPADLDAPLERVDDEPLDAPLELVDDEPHTDDFVFGDEDDDFFADEFDEPDPGEGEVAGPLPEAPPESARYVAEPEPHGAPLIDDPAAGPLDQPTQQYALEDVEDATRPPEPPPPEPPPPAPPPPVPEAGAEDEPEGEELLEETPEFLEETPEHDRLWFEQKPPRDFDF
ncbi:MAG: hypothetical protein M3370_11715, partial [Actinomycetota bacterium]|nr:hypothetical protein [Actinomycetota bacterium]